MATTNEFSVPAKRGRSNLVRLAHKTVISNKIIGYVLLIIGVLLILVPLWHTYNIFTGKAIPAQLFLNPVSPNVTQKVDPMDFQGQIQNALIKMLPLESINNTLNLASWLVLVWILIYGGGKIAGIGVKLVNGNKE